MWFWTGLYEEVDKEMLINGVNIMLRVAADLLLPSTLPRSTNVSSSTTHRMDEGLKCLG